jgi:hypothetical protein
MPAHLNPRNSEICQPDEAVHSQSFIVRNNFEICETATRWIGWFVLDFGTTGARFDAVIDSFLIQFSKMPCERGAGNAKEPRGLPLITRSLLVNEADMSRDGRSEREVAVGMRTICFCRIWLRLIPVLAR